MSNPLHTIEVDEFLPTGGRALIRPDPRKSKSQGGIILPDGGTHGAVRLGTMLDQGPPRWDNGHLAPLPVPDFGSSEAPVRVMYFESRFTPVRVWTGEWEEIRDPSQPGEFAEGEEPTVKVKVYEELHIIPHPGILGPVSVEEVQEDLPESERVAAGSVKSGPGIAVPSPALTKAVTARQIPRGKILRP